MLNRTLSFILILTVLAANFSRCFIYAGFEANQKYIAAELCVNKNKPMLHCNGKCYLAKKIKQAEEKEKNEEHQSQKNRFQEAMISQKMGLDPTFSFELNIRFGDIDSQITQISTGVFHPPKV